MNNKLPPCVYLKHGAYWLVKRGKWNRLTSNLAEVDHLYHLWMANDFKPPSSGNTPLEVDAYWQYIETLNKERAEKNLPPKFATKTHYNYFRCSLEFKRVFAEFNVDEITTGKIYDYIETIEHTPAQANLVLSFMTNFFGRLAKKDRIKFNPAKGIEKFKQKHRERFISDEEYLTIRKHAEKRLQLLMDLALLSGQRIGDLLTIENEDINDDHLFVLQQKTKTKVKITLTPLFRELINEIRNVCNVKGSSFLFHHTQKMKTTRPGDKISYGAMFHHWDHARDEAMKELPSLSDRPHFHDIRAKTASEVKTLRGREDSKELAGHKSDTSNNPYQRLTDPVMPHESEILMRPGSKRRAGKNIPTSPPQGTAAVIEFRTEARHKLIELPWHPQHTITHTSEDRVTLSFPLNHDREDVVAKIIANMAHLKVIGPSSLREQVREQLALALAAL